MGNKTVEEVLGKAGEKGKTIEEVLGAAEQAGAEQTRGVQETARTVLGFKVEPMTTLIRVGGQLAKGGVSFAAGEALSKAGSMAPPPYRLPLMIGGRLVGQAGGQAAAELGRQRLAGEPIDLSRAKAEGATMMGTGMLLEGLGAGAAYAGGVKPANIGRALENPRANLKKPTPTDWYNLGEDIIGDTAAEAMIKTEGRRRMENILRMSDASGRLIDGRNMVDLLRRRISGSTHPALAAADAKLLSMADDLERDILARSQGSGFLKPSEFDELFQRDFTRPKFDAANVPEWGPDFKGRHSQVRDQIAEKFYSELGPEMGQAAKEAHNTIMARENMESELFPRTGEPKPGRVGQRLRSTMSESNISGIDTTRALEAYDKAYPGKNFSERLRNLNVRESFTPVGAKEGQELAQLGIMNYKPRGLVSAGLVKIARKLMQYGGNSPTGVAARALAADMFGEAQRIDGGENSGGAPWQYEAPRSMP